MRHLPGWYAQKHPEEDWAETFAVWMTPGLDWRSEYADWPDALAKLDYCDRTLAEVRNREPPVTAADLDEDVAELTCSLDQFYGAYGVPEDTFPHSLDRALRSVFEDLAPPQGAGSPASALVRRLEQTLAADVYRWTGHFPERTRPLLRHLAARADELRLKYAPAREAEGVVGLTVLVTALAMNHIRHGSYVP